MRKEEERFFSYLICIYMVIASLIPSKAAIHGFAISSDYILLVILIYYVFKLVFSARHRTNFIIGISDFFTNPLSIAMCILFLVMLLSCSYAADKRIAVKESLRFLTYIILYFIIKYEYNSRKITDVMLGTYIFVVSLIGVMGIIQFFTGIGLDSKFTGYAYSSVKIAVTLDNPNALGAFMIIGIFPLLMLAVSERNTIKKGLYACISLLLIVNMILTYSRNALLAFIIGIVVLVFIYSWKLILVLGAFACLSLFHPAIAGRIKAIGDFEQNISRIYLWKIAQKMIQDHPILGVGNGNYTSLYGSYIKKYPDYNSYGYQNPPCHNSYLKVQTELGVAGSVAFIGMLVSAVMSIRSFIKRTEEEYYKAFYKGFIVSMIVFFIMNLVDNLFFVPKVAIFFWILIAIAEGRMFIQRNGREYLF